MALRLRRSVTHASGTQHLESMQRKPAGLAVQIKIRGTLVLNLPETAISGLDPTYYLQFPFATRRICKTWAGLSLPRSNLVTNRSVQPMRLDGSSIWT